MTIRRQAWAARLSTQGGN